ncbi:hypothetical protein FO519_002636 [Halicephalobus sp. NKZ332]|nr:hypothetical protein FO519_002636 [Halicephalobus sp. NKZ332]
MDVSGKCHSSPLGMESGDIVDGQITASSSFDEQSVGPQNARIRTEKASGAWCPKSQIRNESYEFLQINLNSTFIITKVETQGRYGNGTGAEFVNEYYLDYFRSGGTWIRYKNRTGHQLMTGNKDTVTSVMRDLDPPIVASKIRIVPHSDRTRTVCLRAELHGCDDFENLEAYSTSKEGTGDFRDRIFEDTKEVDTIMGSKKGLGLLTDGFISTSDPKSSSNSSWIGWSKNTTSGSVVIIFEFDRIKNFTDVELFAWGEPINEIEVEFSEDGSFFDPQDSVFSTYPKESNSDFSSSYSIRIPLPKKSGRFVRFRLSFQGSWIFLTEVGFNSVLFNETIGFESGASEYRIWYYVMVAVLILLFLFFFAFLIIFYFLRKKFNGKKKMDMDSRSFNPSGTYKSTLLVTTLGSNGVPKNIIQPHGKIERINFFEKGSTQRILSHSSRSVSTGTMKDTPPSLLDINFPPPPPSTGSNESTSDGTYGDSSQSAPLIGYPPPTGNGTPQKKKPIPSSRKTKTLPNRPSIVDEEGFTLAGIPTVSHSFDQVSPLVRIPQKSITLGEQIGEGKFTAIYLCEISGINQTSVVKIIKEEAEDVEAASKALFCESQILAALDHPNIIKLYGITETPSVIIEYLPLGSVREFITSEKDKLTFGSLLHFCTNIAAGMKYLEQRRIVHGHLSPRNCLIESNLNVKIAAPRGPLHHAQLRYSAPESIILNEWTHKSDAWSFAVTVWEILHYCSQVPFDKLTNQQIVDNARELIDGAPHTWKLNFRDDCCPPEIRDLMLECLEPNPEMRPAFIEIQLFLSRKAMSFTLQHKRQRPVGLKLPQSVSMYR